MLGEQYYYLDFTKWDRIPDNWTAALGTQPKPTKDGLEFTWSKAGDAPQLWSDFWLYPFVEIEYVARIAKGQGIISSVVLWSDVKDEIDFEYTGNNFGNQPWPPPPDFWSFQPNLWKWSTLLSGGNVRVAGDITEEFNTYGVDINPRSLAYKVNGRVHKEVYPEDTPDGWMPGTPYKWQMGVWAGGGPEQAPGTIEWAGGPIQPEFAPFTLTVKALRIKQKKVFCSAKYIDRVGRVPSPSTPKAITFA